MAEMLIDGGWVGSRNVITVESPYSGEVVDEVPVATTADVERALKAAERGAEEMRALPAHERAEILSRAADAVAEDLDDLAVQITSEQGKPIAEARAEARRVPEILSLAAGEAIRLTGEVLPMDATAAGENRLGFTLPEPTGIVLALTPFNYPALLVMHKVAPALAAGNAVLLKPASATPLTSFWLCRKLVEAGLPATALQCLSGPGGTVGAALARDPRVRKVSFTGSAEVGAAIARDAGLKRLTVELGSTAAVLVFDDAELEQAAAATARAAFTNAGQVCISAQRVLVASAARDEFVGRTLELAREYACGPPLESSTTLGPVISGGEAGRVMDTIEEARAEGGKVLLGGERDPDVPSRHGIRPTVVADPPVTSRLWREELFGPAIGVRSFATAEEAVAVANEGRYGLAVGVFTRDVDRAMTLMRGLVSGVVHINSAPLWRTDAMPYGGRRDSGFGREGVPYAVEEMTEHKTVVIHPSEGG